MSSNTVLCTSTTCPSTELHNSGAYNFLQCTKLMPTPTKVLPSDVREVADRTFWNGSEDFADNNGADFKFLAKFVAVHNGCTSGLLPKDIGNGKIWTQHSGIQAILKAGDENLAAQRKADALKAANFKTATLKAAAIKATKVAVKAPVKTEEKKFVLPMTRRRNGMGRCLDLTKKIYFTPAPKVTVEMSDKARASSSEKSGSS